MLKKPFLVPQVQFGLTKCTRFAVCCPLSHYVVGSSTGNYFEPSRQRRPFHDYTPRPIPKPDRELHRATVAHIHCRDAFDDLVVAEGFGRRIASLCGWGACDRFSSGRIGERDCGRPQTGKKWAALRNPPRQSSPPFLHQTGPLPKGSA